MYKHSTKDELVKELKRQQQYIKELESIIRYGYSEEHFKTELERQVDYRTRELVEAAQWMTDIIDTIDDGFCAIDPKQRFTYINQAAEEIIGRPREAILGQSMITFFKFDPIMLEKYNQVLREKVPQNYEFFSRTLRKWVEVSLYPNQTGILVFFRNIMERKKAEELIAAEQKRFNDILELLPAYLILLTPEYHVPFANRLFRERFGESQGKRCFEYLFGRSEPCEICRTYEVLKTMSPLEWEWTGPDGRNYYVYDFPFTDADGSVLIMETGIDITELKKAEAELVKLNDTLQLEIQKHRKYENDLRQSEEKFSKAFYGSPIMMLLENIKEGKFIDANEAFLAGTGYSRETIVGHTIWETNFYADLEKRQERMEILVETGKFESVEIEFHANLGEIRHGLAWSQLLLLDEEQCHLTCLLDITEQKRIEQEMARLERLNLLGEMAASIGHEIRNPMTAVRGFIQLLKEQECYEKDTIYFELMIEELDRANEIISEYLGIARDKFVELQPQNLDQVVKAIYPMLEADANYKDMKIKLELGKPPMIPLDQQEIRQVILNLARNGLEAMSPGGTLTIGTMVEKHEMVLFVKDEGTGLEPGILDKLGTPFLTTKEKGTGLGLAVCYSIAAHHNARLEVETSPNGTTIKMRFPQP